MHGVIITSGLQDWEVLGQAKGSATVTLQGTYTCPQAALEVGVASAVPIVRVLHENDNSPIIFWQPMEYTPAAQPFCGSWHTTLTLPAGGPYRIETGLDTQSTDAALQWIFRGDVRLHIGVGHVFLISGQSNASGYGRDTMPDAPSPQVHLLRNCLRWDMASHPINESTDAPEALNAEMGISGTSPFLSFGKELAAKTNLPVGLIVASMGGQPLRRWDSTQQGDLLENMLHRAALCQGPLAGVLWYQGCTDAMEDAAAACYADTFARFVADTRSALGYCVPFFTFQLNRFYDGKGQDDGWGIVREAQRKAPQHLPEVYVLPTAGQPVCDYIHNSSSANVLLGAQLARQCYSVLQQQPIALAPEIIAATCVDTTLTLAFSNVSRGLIICNPDPAQTGIVIQDAQGVLPITAVQSGRKCPAQIILTLARKPQPGAVVSLGAQTAPPATQPMDEFTYLPALAFYRFPVTFCTESQ